MSKGTKVNIFNYAGYELENKGLNCINCAVYKLGNNGKLILTVLGWIFCNEKGNPMLIAILQDKCFKRI